jgi:predicted nucleic acid-binding protein
MLIDTDVLIDLNRELPAAVEFIMKMPARPMISAITITELYAGVRDGRERDALERFIASSVVLEVDTQVAERGGLLGRQYLKSHGTGFADAVIAATAEIVRATLVTLNDKHFPMLNDVLVPYRKT